MKLKLINAGLILTSLLGYLEWGGNHSAFLFSAEAEVISKLIHNPSGAIHPFTVLPLLGQIILIITLFQSPPRKKFTYSGMALVGVLMIFIFFIGIMGLNVRIAFSVLPFLLLAVYAIRQNKKHQVTNSVSL